MVHYYMLVSARRTAPADSRDRFRDRNGTRRGTAVQRGSRTFIPD